MAELHDPHGHGLAGGYGGGGMPDAAGFYGAVDASPSAAKQLAALNAAAIARRSQAGGTSGGVFGVAARPGAGLTDSRPPHMQLPLQLQAMTPPPDPADPRVYKQRQQTFLNGLATVMQSRGTPLPPALTGVAANFDRNTSPWKTLELTGEPGVIRLAGRPVDLFKLWGFVFNNGGSQKFHQLPAGWAAVLPHLQLPDRMPDSTPTATVLAHYYKVLLGPFEEVFFRNMELNAKNAVPQTPIAPNRMPPAGVPGFPPQVQAEGMGMPQQFAPQNPGFMPNMGHPAQQMRPNHAVNGALPAAPLASPAPVGDMDPASLEARKRKLAEGDIDDKRARRKTDGQVPGAAPLPQGPLRRKIEYIPINRELNTGGGRDVLAIEAELLKINHGRPLRDVHDWGNVDVEHLTMSMRSRIPSELSYSLTTLTLLSTLRGGTPTAGFPILQCVDLLDELLDLMEEMAFNRIEEEPPGDLSTHHRIVTHREMANLVQQAASETFAPLKEKKVPRDCFLGPYQQKADIIKMILMIFRNFASALDNQQGLATHPIFVDVLLRLTAVRLQDDKPVPASPNMTLTDFIVIRRDVMGVLGHLGGFVHLGDNNHPSSHQTRRARRLFELMASYLTESTECLTPYTLLLQAGRGVNLDVRAPSLVDQALDVFTRISQPDANRQVFGASLPNDWIWTLVHALGHRLPVADLDFQVVARESWMSYTEKIVLAIYALAFLMPPDVKRRAKSDVKLGLTKVMFRMVKKFLSPVHGELRNHLAVCARRCIEALKIIDSCTDSFDAAQTNAPSLTFGVGYGEVGENRVEKGTGIFGGHQDEVWAILAQTDLDDVMFSELESLARVDMLSD